MNGSSDNTNQSIIAQYEITRVCTVWKNERRIFQLVEDSVVIVDPSTFEVTHIFNYADIESVNPEESRLDHFSLDVKKFGIFLFKTSFRSRLLCRIFKCLYNCVANASIFEQFSGHRVTKILSKLRVSLEISKHGILEYNESKELMKEYFYCNITKVGIDKIMKALFFEYSGRIKVFILEDRFDEVIAQVEIQLRGVGLSSIQISTNKTYDEIINIRKGMYDIIGASVAVFDVHKISHRHHRPTSRQLHITEEFILEKDSSGNFHSSCHRLHKIYALVRIWDNAKQFKIEYDDNSSSIYECSVRDTLLATLLDICHAIGNMKVVVTDAVIDNLRLVPRGAESYSSSVVLFETIFGTFTIQSWLLLRLALISRKQNLDIQNIISLCYNINANLLYPGITAHANISHIKYVTAGIMKGLRYLMDDYIEREDLSYAKYILVLLQSFYRMLSHPVCFQFVLEVREVDIRLLIVQLLYYQCDFINYWSIMILYQLTASTHQPRSLQQEFTNKQAILIDIVLSSVIGLISSGLHNDDDDIVGEEENDVVYADTNINQTNHQNSDKMSKLILPPFADSSNANINMSDSRDKQALKPLQLSSRGKESDNQYGDTNDVKSGNGTLNNRIPPNLHTDDNNNGKNIKMYVNDDGGGGVGGGNADADGSDFLINNMTQIKEGKYQNENLCQQQFQKDFHARRNCEDSGKKSSKNTFSPNALVIVAATALLESVVSSCKDTTSPELMVKVLDLLSDHCDALINMLRSTSFIIMENAAVLMHVLITNRKTNTLKLQEYALSECLALKHFYNAMYSPSSTQRFISRFLVSNWLSGDETSEGKMLLRRMLPSGLIEYLNYNIINDEQSNILDSIEEEFYASNYCSGLTLSSHKPLKKLHERMKKRLVTAQIKSTVSLSVTVTTNVSNQNNALISTSSTTANNNINNMKKRSYDSNSTSGSSYQTDANKYESDSNYNKSNMNMNKSHKYENFRIMFHAMTRNHTLPDLIWNNKTRLELKSALESEITGFEREQRLYGIGNIIWNYKHFSIHYFSLDHELQIGPIYIKYFLTAGDSFIRTLHNPTHNKLFEKLLRRILVYMKENVSYAILCCKCMKRLYSICYDKIDTFDDMLLIVHLMSQVEDMELLQHLFDLLHELSIQELNLSQLINVDFVAAMLKYSSLAHLNPEKIGNELARETNIGDMLLLTNNDTIHGLKVEDNSNIREKYVNTSIDETYDGEYGGKENLLEEVKCQGEDVEVEVDMNRDVDIEDTAHGKETIQTDGTVDHTVSCTDVTKRYSSSLWLPEDSYCPRIWYVSNSSTIPPPVCSQRGPYRVSELCVMLCSNQMNKDWLVAPSMINDHESEDNDINLIVDTGRWRPLRDNFQLRLQLLFTGNAIYEPAEVSLKSLDILLRLSDVHKMTPTKDTVSYPIPMSKRMIAEQEYLSILAQLLLCNNSLVIDVTAQLIQRLVEDSDTVCSKLYLTGLFFFACRYTGNNFNSISQLLYHTHLRQSFHETIARPPTLCERSALGSILPAALLNILEKYGPERFSEVYCGDYNTPEVIWNAFLRKHTVDMINQHLGDFTFRLKQNTVEKYEYCPIPRVHYERLEKELYCNNYYLRNLCDESKFNHWRISDPLSLLHDIIQCWSTEMSKQVEDISIKEAKLLLGLSDDYNITELRKAYKLMARKYHPDKNPNGKHIFEKILISYDLLSSVSHNMITTDYNNVLIIMKSQILLYKRFHEILYDQKYSAYDLLINILSISIKSNNKLNYDNNDNDGTSKNAIHRNNQNEEFYSSSTMHNDIYVSLQGSSIELIYQTLVVSPYNTDVFINADGLPRLYEALYNTVACIDRLSVSEDVLLPATEDGKLITFAMKAIAIIFQFELGRNAANLLCPKLAVTLYHLLSYSKYIPLAVEHCIMAIANGASDASLQRTMVSAGVIWRLVPMLLSYDGTLKDIDVNNNNKNNESMRLQFNQHVANMHAVLAARALGRLAGVMFDELASPLNLEVKYALGRLLTPPIAKLLRNRQPWELLEALNDNVEKPTKIWNINMRFEVLSFVQTIDKNRINSISEIDLKPCLSFVFSSLTHELHVGGVYLRLFVATKDVSDVDDPSVLCSDLLQYINEFLTNDTQTQEEKPTLAHQSLAVESLRILAETVSYVARDIATASLGVKVVVELVCVPPDVTLSLSAAQLLLTVSCSSDFVLSLAKHPFHMSSLLQLVCSDPHTPPTAILSIWAAIEAISVVLEGLQALLDVNAVPLLLAVIFSITGFQSAYNNRQSALSLLSKMLLNPVKGSLTASILQRYVKILSCILFYFL